ncbi:hypothetical protein [Dyadobacter fanqingshengii]|uniref:Uncharacterized protein n=1 Tax=Dyadobacter fanqingshengii TaxID=2906443 RepID=A0A9X1T9A9_9BACT|nr:hypothetical protein [Dyadobacter fanqingshengii]MCF0039739.1 hypothetical protein [Dyadobacter fanqingshengii]USJ38499.1 hypothetical protein NFI81_12100 [Dyadobacter fanqingshengii]
MKPSDNSNNAVETVLTFAATLLIGYGIYRYFIKSRVDTGGSNRDASNDPGTAIPPFITTDTGSLRARLEKHFEEFRLDVGQYELSTYYSYQFGILGEQKPTSRRQPIIANLSELGLNPQEVQQGNLILTSLAQEITRGRLLGWGQSLIFLQDYHSIEGKIDILHTIYNKLTKKELADKFLKELEHYKNELIARYR